MGSYLNKFKGTIGKRQTEQVLKLLNEKRNVGQIRSVQEFTEQFKNLMNELTTTTLTPSLKLYLNQSNDFTSSEQYNFMLDRTQDDLEAAFEEASKIDEVQQAHSTLIRDVILKNLRAAMYELESKITLYEFLNKDLRGFDTAIFSTFRESKDGRTFRGTDLSQILFVDPRTNLPIPPAYDATVELIGERLVLPEDTFTKYDVHNVRQIFDNTTPQSELIVEPSGTQLNYMLDGTTGTYWVQSLLFKDKQSSIKVKLEFDLGVFKEINFIQIEPVIRDAIVLEAIHYVDGNNIVTDSEFPECTVSGPISIRLRKIATNRIILTFRNEHPVSSKFEYDEKRDQLLRQAIVEPPGGYTPDIKQVSNDLNKLIASAKIKEIVGVTLNDSQVFSGYEFLTGFDNINIGLADYKDTGIYLSTPLKIDMMGEIGLKTLESRPYAPAIGGVVQYTDETYDHDSDNELTFSGDVPTGGRLFYGSIEYWVIRQEFSSEDVLLRTTVFPIMPLGISRIHQERLVLTTKSSSTEPRSDLGQTLFFTNTDTDEGNIKVYRNGTELTDVSNDATATSGWKHYPANPPLGPHGDASDRRPDNGDSMKFRIQVLSPLSGDIFTVTYNPLTSSTRVIPSELEDYDDIDGLKVVDMVGDLSARLADGKLIIVDKPVDDLDTVNTKVYLSVILRQNTADTTLAPAVEEYTLVAGKKDITKFEED